MKQTETEDFTFIENPTTEEPVRAAGVVFTQGKFTFQRNSQMICHATKGHFKYQCTHVHVKPRQCEEHNRYRVFFNESKLSIYCDSKISKIFVKDDIAKVYSSSKVDLHMYQKGMNCGFWEVAIISTRDTKSYSDEDLLQFHRPHCLILVLDCPQSLFFCFPSKKQI